MCESIREARGFADRVEEREHLLKMLELLARELRKRLLKEPVMGIREEELDRRARRLLFTMRVVEQHVVEVRRGAGQPGGVGIRGEVEHGDRSLPTPVASARTME